MISFLLYNLFNIWMITTFKKSIYDDLRLMAAFLVSTILFGIGVYLECSI